MIVYNDLNILVLGQSKKKTFFYFCNFFFQKWTVFSYQTNKQKKIAAARLARITATRWTGNRLFLWTALLTCFSYSLYILHLFLSFAFLVRAVQSLVKLGSILQVPIYQQHVSPTTNPTFLQPILPTSTTPKPRQNPIPKPANKYRPTAPANFPTD